MSNRPGFYTFTQIMRRYGMPVELAKQLYMAGYAA